MGGCRCSFRSCLVSTSRNPGMHFFHFPFKDKERFAKWVQMANVPQLLTMPINVAKNRVVCARHFRDECFMNYKRDRLVCNGTAIPTLIRLNDKLAWDYEGTAELNAPTLIELNVVTMAHLLPPPEYESPFTLHDNLPDDYAPKMLLENSGEIKLPVAKQVLQKSLKRNCSPTSDSQIVKVVKILNKTTPIPVTQNKPSNATADSVVSIRLSLSSDLEDNSVGSGASEDDDGLEYLWHELENSADIEDAIESELISRKQHVNVCKSEEKQLEAKPHESNNDAQRMLAQIQELESSLKSVEQKYQEKTEQIQESDKNLSDYIEKYDKICKQNASLYTTCLAYEEKNAALAAELRLLKEENDALQQKCTTLELNQQLQTPQVEKVSTSVQAAIPTSTPAPTPAPTPASTKTGAKQTLTKGQLFNNVRKYMSASMAALLRMEMFGSAEREWKPDERRAAMELLQLGENVYKFVNDEWRMRLPAMRQVRTWLSEDDPDLDDEDL